MTDQFEGTVETVPDLSGHALDLLRSGDGPKLTINKDDLIPVDGVAGLDNRQLADLAKTEHRMACEAVDESYKSLSLAIIHGIAAGEALLELKRRHEGSHGSWMESLESLVEIPYTRAAHYMRWALHKDHLLQADGPVSTKTVHTLLRGLPPVPHATTPADAAAEEVKRLHSEGVPVRAIADLTGIPRSTVKRQVDPSYRKAQRDRARERQKEARAAKRALQEKQQRDELDTLAKNAGGALSKSYSLVRQCAAQLDIASKEATTEQRRALAEAMRKAHAAEDEIVKALRLGRTDV